MSTPLPWHAGDPLTAALYQLRMRGAFYSWTEAQGSCGISMPTFPGTLSFHIVARGTAWLEVDGAEPVRLSTGELALVPRGIGHRISTTPGAPVLGRADQLPQDMLGEMFSVLRIAGDPAAPGDEPGADQDHPAMQLLCGVVAFDSAAVDDMLAVLPSLLRVDSRRHAVMRSLLPLLTAELSDPRPGGEAVATRLADLLVVETVRSWLSDEPDAATGWLAALRDPQLGSALAALHREPARAWSLPELARRASMSRSAFAARFNAVVGMPAVAYATTVRMRSARAMLADGRSVAEVALAHGYGSEAAFSRAFRRVTGQTPGRVRRAA